MASNDAKENGAEESLRWLKAFKVNKGRDMDKQLFEQGKRDCEAGIPHKPGKGESYDYGYSWAYAEGERK